MDWTKQSNAIVNINDKPRFLTDNDINNILDNYLNNKNSNLYFPEPPGADKDSRELARQCTVDWIISETKKVQLSPSLIPKFIFRIIQAHYKSLIAPGTPVAIGAGHAVGATTTQMTLNSVAPWEKLLIQRRNGVGMIVEIGKWIDLLLKQVDPAKIVHIEENRTEYYELEEPVKIVTTDNDGNVTWEDVTAITRHLPVGDLVRIKTKSGRSVTATQQKSFLVWDEVTEEIVQTNGSDLKEGNLIPIANQIPEPSFTYDVLNLKDYLDTKEWIYMSEMEKLNQDYLDYDVPGKQRFWSSTDRLVNLPYNREDSYQRGYRELKKKNIIGNYVFPKSWGGSSNNRIPEEIVMDRKFGTLVGLYLAEGLVTDTYMCISNNDPNIRQIVYDWFDGVGVKYHTDVSVRDDDELHNGTSTDIKIHSVLFARLFETWIGTGSAYKTIPEEILFGNREFIIGVLDGYFAGDGCVEKKYGCLSISSVSEALIDGFIFLCSRLGIFGRKSQRLQKKNNKGSKNIRMAYVCTIRALNANLWHNIIGSCHPDKQERMDKEYKRINEWGEDYVKHENIMLDPIISIDYIKDIKYVYDLTVPKTLNFALYNGLCCADTFHSSGSAVSATSSIDALRDIIYARKVPKNEGCTIYYKNKFITYEEALDTRRYIVGSLVSDFISDFDIDTPENIKGGKKWWSDADELYDNQIPNSNLVMRLFLNVVEMYKQRVTIKELADVLEREVSTKSPSVVVRYGPISDGIIDIYPSDQIKKTINETLYKNNKASEKIAEIDTLVESTYLESIVYPELKNVRVKGIKGLRNLYPKVIKVWDIVLSERKDIDDKWLLTLHQDKMYLHGIDRENVIKLCQSAGLVVSTNTTNNDSISIIMPRDRFRTTNNDLVIDIRGTKFRNINFSNINDDLSTLKVIEGMLYEEIDEKLIKTKTDEYYEIEIEEKTKRPTGPNRWIETEVPAKLIIVNINDIIPLNKKSYIKVSDLYSIKNDVPIRLYDLVIKDKVLYSGNDIIDNLYQDLSNLIRVGKTIKELKPSEYVNNKISEAKRSYQDKVTKRTNEIIESSPKQPKEMIKRTITFPKYELNPKIPYDDIVKYLIANNIEIKQNKLDNVLVAQKLAISTFFADIPASIGKWLEEGGDVTIEEKGAEVVVEEEKVVKMKIPINIDRPEILKLSEFVVAVVEIVAPAKDLKIRVPMFRSLLGLSFVDKQRTTCNNMHTLTNVFGIESARTFIIDRLYNIIKDNSSYVHPAHIIFIAEFITSRGVPFGTTFTGISRQPGGHLSLATVERAGKTLTQHALHGRKEDIRNVSASISVGQRMVIGNGMFDIAQDVTEDNKTKTLINDDVFKAHKYEVETEEIESEEEESKLEIISDTPELEPLQSDPDVIIDYVSKPTVLKKFVFGKTKKEVEEFKPVMSEGLVILTELEPSNLGNGLPESLLVYFDKYGL
jgi:DNA-directed RNA polymerase subunit A"